METTINRLKRLTSSGSEPLLTDTDLNAALESAAIRDAAGNGPNSPSWVPTYDVAAAAVEAWLVKAARASTIVEVDSATGAVSSKVFENCMAMARMYRMKRNSTSRVR